MWINNSICKISYPEVAISRLALISNDFATNFRRFSNDSTSRFWVWTCATRCSTAIPIDIQYSWKSWHVISPLLSKQNFLIG